MAVSWKKEYDPQQLTQRVEANKNVDASGKVSFPAFEHTEHTVLIHSMLEFPSSIPQVEARRIVTQAIFSVAGKRRVTPRTLLARTNQLANEFLDSPTERYVLVTSVSIGRTIPLREIRTDGAIIKFERQLPDRYHREAMKILSRAEYSLSGDLPIDYLYTRVHVSARSIYEAANVALGTLNLVRGIWNWFLNSKQFIRMSFGGKRVPVNKIVLGPVHTLHYLTGKLAATSTWWYEPGYAVALQVYNPDQRIVDDVFLFLRRVRDELKRCKFRDSIEEAITRYTRALDERDWNTAFLKLWGVLELLTYTQRAAYATTIRRASFLFEDRSYHRQVLSHLRNYRNSLVHADVENTEIEVFMYQLKGYVEALFRFHLGNRYGFESLEEACAFLSLPSDVDVLESRIRMMECARRFLEGTS